MSSVKVWQANKDTTTRVTDSGGLGQGAGASTRLYVGRRGASGTRRNYRSYLRFNYDWTDVNKIISAILTLTTDDGLGEFPVPSGSNPRVVVRRLTDSFSEGNDSGFTTSDYTTAAGTTTGQKVKQPMSQVVSGQTDIDVTEMVRAHAPSSVQGGGKKTNYGFLLLGSNDTDEEWSGYSREASAPLRPFITLTYELGATTPNTPTNLSPSGAVASISAFEGDFSDPRSSDTLKTTEVQVYTNSAVKSGDADTDDTIDVTAHGYTVGQQVWFHSLTGGAGLSVNQVYYVKTVVDANSFKVSVTPGGTVVNITSAYSALTVASPKWVISKAASNTEILNDRSFVLPAGLHLTRLTNYKWRMRQKDQEDKWSAWVALVTFQVTNTDPVAPVLTPATGSQYDSLNGVLFRGTYSDADGDALLAYQVQLSTLAEGNPSWDDADLILWDTGKRYVASGSTDWETLYGGRDLTAAVYTWRARHWDEHNGLSDWEYATIEVLTDFDAEPGTQTSVQADPHAPWRVRIREMAYNSIASLTGAITGVAATDLFTSAKNHGLVAGQRLRFSSITGGTGLFTDRTYYVISSGLTAKDFKVSETRDGATVDFTTAVTAAVVTIVTTRGPGNVVGILENAKSVGASIVYNSPGEAHFTIPVDHPFISVIEPKQVHYGIDFYTGDGWRETYAGLVWDYDATETSVVYPCIDYLALYDLVSDERYFPSDPDRSYTKGGSKYVNVSIRTVVLDQLNRAKSLANSPVGFITVGTVDAMNELVTIWSTMQPVLSFVGGLLDSHRQGTGKKTRIQVRRTTGGGYEVIVQDDPGQIRENLRLQYGEIVQGYRVIPFGPDWASIVHGIGRTREGIRVLYKTASAPGIDPKVWGRIAKAIIIDNVSDEKDLERRTKQAAIQAGKLGKGMALALRHGFLKPRDGYDICDVFPIKIAHGAVDTDAFGSGYWVCVAVTWEAGDDASSSVVPTLMPREDTVSPDDDLVGSNNISTQAEWQLGWLPPNPTKATSKFWLDQATGIVYERDDDTLTALSVTGTV